jgi:GntR family transcriptional regulator
MVENAVLFDSHSRIPAYIQVASALRRRIEIGHWQVHEKISTLEELEAEFNLSRVTVSKAIELLEEEGLVTRQQGRGTFVSGKLSDKRWLQLETTWASMIQSIEGNVPNFIQVSDPPLRPRLEEGEARFSPEYVYLRSVQTKDGNPYAIVNLHLAKSIFDRKKTEFLRRTALPVLAKMVDVKIRQAYQTMTIQTTDPETASLLKISLSAPTAACRCVVINDDQEAIYVAEITYRSDCIKLFMSLID